MRPDRWTVLSERCTSSAAVGELLDAAFDGESLPAALVS
jgi:hypothetical protein